MRGLLFPRAELREDRLCAMQELFQRHFVGVDPKQFRHDLASKDWIINLEDNTGDLVGFSSLQLRTISHRGQDQAILYSGDTIMDPRAWRSSILSRTWGHAVFHLKAQMGNIPFWWVLLSSGFRTYRFLPVFFQNYWPCPHQESSPETVAFAHRLALDQYGDAFFPEEGLVRFPKPQVLRPHLNNHLKTRLRNPHVAYFVEKNPHHHQGDELLCLAEVSKTNLRSAAHRILDSAQVRVADSELWVS